VIFDRRLRTRSTARVVGTLADGPVVVFTTLAALRHRPEAAAALEAAGVQVEAFDDEGLRAPMKRLAEMGVSSLLLEGGAVLHASAWDAGIIDRVQLYIAPRVLGSAGVSLFNGRRFSVTELTHGRIEFCGDDVLIEGDVHRTD
jgi:diaminohydroxyphosphoribosylaminopyrimidine deaminase/5-amino-6-(5-phosphoribosylamino)uracil reductase